MIRWEIVLPLLGLIATLFAVRYARKSWLNPVPLIECLSKSAEFFKSDNGKYVIRLNMSFANIGGVPAMIKKIEVNDFIFSLNVSEQKHFKFKVPDKIRNLYPDKFPETIDLPRNILRHSISPNTILKNSGYLYMALPFEDCPKKITVRIYTSNRTFKFVIKDIKEETNLLNVRNWLK